MIYLTNRSPTKSVHDETPREAWNERKSKIGHSIKMFGSVAYAHVSKKKRTKLDNGSEELIFISYYASLKGYHLYNPFNGKVINSRDVFHEESSWDWNIQKKYDIIPEFEEKITDQKWNGWNFDHSIIISVKWSGVSSRFLIAQLNGGTFKQFKERNWSMRSLPRCNKSSWRGSWEYKRLIISKHLKSYKELNWFVTFDFYIKLCPLNSLEVFKSYKS